MQLNLFTEKHGTSCINCKDDVNDRDPELEKLNTEIIEEKQKKNTKKSPKWENSGHRAQDGVWSEEAI